MTNDIQTTHTVHPATGQPAGSVDRNQSTVDATDRSVIDGVDLSDDHTDPDSSQTYGYLTNNHKADYLRRLRRIEGQARGLQRMIEDEKYCIDILTQVSAMNRALESVALGLLDDHLDHCVTEAATTGGDEAHQKLQEASQAIARMVRS